MGLVFLPACNGRDPCPFEAFAPGQPDNFNWDKCLQLDLTPEWRGNGRWRDVNCYRWNMFVCERVSFKHISNQKQSIYCGGASCPVRLCLFLRGFSSQIDHFPKKKLSELWTGGCQRVVIWLGIFPLFVTFGGQRACLVLVCNLATGKAKLNRHNKRVQLELH